MQDEACDACFIDWLIENDKYDTLYDEYLASFKQETDLTKLFPLMLPH